MQLPNKEFEFDGEYYPLDCSPKRVGKAKIEDKFKELKTSYEYGFSQISSYSGEVYGKVELTKAIIFQSDSAVDVINFAMKHSDLVLDPLSVKMGGYGSMSTLKFYKNDQMVEQDLAELRKQAEEYVERYVKKFNEAKAVAISDAVHNFEQYKQYQQDQKLQEQQTKQDNEAFFRGLSE